MVEADPCSGWKKFACKFVLIHSNTQLSTCVCHLFFKQGGWEWSAAAYLLAVTLKHSLKTWH